MAIRKDYKGESYSNRTVSCGHCGKISRRVYCADSREWECRCGAIGSGTIITTKHL